MKSLSVLFFVAAVAAEVKVLTPDNFDNIVGKGKHALVEFYAPWCGHCQRLEPTYTELGNMYPDNSNVVIAKVDADAHSDLGQRFGVKGFPTIKWFSKGSVNPEDYTKGREIGDFVEFIAEKTGVQARQAESPVVELDDTNFDAVALNNSQNVFVEFYASWCGHCKNLEPVYKQVAAAFEYEPSCVIAKIDADKNKLSGAKYGIEGFPTLKFFAVDKKSAPIPYEGGRDAKSLLKFANAQCGTSRTLDGKLDDSAGVIPELTDIVKKFDSAKSQEATLKKLGDELKAALKSLNQKKSPYFKKATEFHIRVVEKSVKKKDYVENELKRLQKLIEKEENIAKDKLDSLIIRRNILRTFAGVSGTSQAHEDL